MIRIKGKIVKGHGEAKKTFPMQLHLLKEFVSGIENYEPRTINILLECPLVIPTPHIKTPPIQWDTRQAPPIPKEIFEFVRIKFEILGKDNPPVDSLIYIAYNSPHYADPFYIEILAPFIEHDQMDFCNIIIEKENK